MLGREHSLSSFMDDIKRNVRSLNDIINVSDIS